MPTARLDGVALHYLRTGEGPALLLIAGIPGVSSEPLAAGIPGARLQVIEGAGHLFFVERPEETASAIADFLG